MAPVKKPLSAGSVSSTTSGTLGGAAGVLCFENLVLQTLTRDEPCLHMVNPNSFSSGFFCSWLVEHLSQLVARAF